MRPGSIRAAALGAIASIGLIAGCSGNASTPALGQGPGAAAQARARVGSPYWHNGVPSGLPAAMAERVFRGDFSGGHRVIPGPKPPAYDYTCSYSNYSPAAPGCQVWSGSVYGTQSGLTATQFPTTVDPQGDVVTIDGTLLIADTGNGTIDAMTGANSGSPSGMSTCVSETSEYPIFVDATKGAKLIAISNIFTASFAAGSLAVAKGCGANPVTLANPTGNFVQGQGVAIDKSGDCYWAYNDLSFGGGYVAKYTGCKGSGTQLQQSGLSNGSSMTFAGGVAFDGRNNMYLNDQGVGVYECTAASSFGSCSVVASGYKDNFGLNFSKGFTYLFVSDTAANQICYTPVPVTSAGTCVKNSLKTPPYGAGPAKASKF